METFRYAIVLFHNFPIFDRMKEFFVLFAHFLFRWLPLAFLIISLVYDILVHNITSPWNLINRNCFIHVRNFRLAANYDEIVKRNQIKKNIISFDWNYVLIAMQMRKWNRFSRYRRHHYYAIILVCALHGVFLSFVLFKCKPNSNL